jgi:hypothetical protein
MKKFEVVNLDRLPILAHFYFAGDKRKKVFEVHSPKPDAHCNVYIRPVGTDLVKRMKTYHSSPLYHRPVKFVFLSSPQDRIRTEVRDDDDELHL